MTHFEVMQSLGIDNATDFIKRIVIRTIRHYSPDTEISNFDEVDIELFIKKFLKKEANEARCRELGIFTED